MMLDVDLFWSFRSPYSYLATPRIVALRDEYDLNVVVRPVYPIAVRDPGFFKDINPLWVPYLLHDVVRVAEMNGLPFNWPSPDPVVMDMQTRTISKEQPYIHRLTHLGVEAARRGRGLEFLDEVSRMLWADAVKDWHEGDHLAGAAARAGLDFAAMEAAVAADEDGYESEIADNEAALEKAGHWGVPTLAFEGEPFFGQDRIDMCVWRMKQKGLQKRAA